nr:immunoglobulin heavy chain junction region [Macaca mulatta]
CAKDSWGGYSGNYNRFDVW